MLNKSLNYNNKVAMLKVLARAKANFEAPRMMHFIFGFSPNSFETDGFCQKFKECFYSEIRALNKGRPQVNAERRKINKENILLDAKSKRISLLKTRPIPDVELIYSIEAKEIKSRESQTVLFRKKPIGKKIYYHVHLMLICDVGKAKYYSQTEIKMCTNKALSRIGGVQDLSSVSVRYGFLKMRDKRSKIKACDEYLSAYWHDLHEEYEDAIIRASYLTKVEQKELLPAKFFNNSFGHTRTPRAKKETAT